MLGSIIGVEENIVLIKLNIDLNKFDSLTNLHVIMENGDKKIVGEIADIKDVKCDDAVMYTVIDGNLY